MADAPAPTLGPLHEPFETHARQRESTLFGIWIFLASELLLFAGLFLVYAAHRWTDGPAFSEAAKHTDVAIGTFNTLLLLTSSASLAIAGRALEAGRRRVVTAGVWLTLLLGLGFLAAKSVEYYKDVQEGLWPTAAFALPEPAGRVFFGLYWVSTGLHACHVTAGLVLIGRLAWMQHRGVLMRRPESMEVTGLYWHLVDAIWVVLYPCLYLVGR